MQCHKVFADNNSNSGILIEESTQLLGWKVLMEMEKKKLQSSCNMNIM